MNGTYPGPRPLTRVELDRDSQKCGCCEGATHGAATWLHGQCHPKAPVQARYQAGVLSIICAVCEQIVVKIQVAEGKVGDAVESVLTGTPGLTIAPREGTRPTRDGGRGQALEKFCAFVAKASNASGSFLAIFHEGERAEVFSAVRPETDLPGSLRKLADSIADGDGMPLGNHGGTA